MMSVILIAVIAFLLTIIVFGLGEEALTKSLIEVQMFKIRKYVK